MLWTVPLPIIRSFSLYTQQWYMSYRFVDNLRAGSGSILILLASCQLLVLVQEYDPSLFCLYDIL